MNRTIETIRLPFVVGFSSFIVSSVSLGLIPFVQFLPDKLEGITNYIVAALFYLGLIVGFFAVRNARGRMYRWRRRLMAERQFKKQRFPGIITFSTDIKHIVLYAICALGILVMVSDMFLHYISEYIMFPILSVVLFTFTLHCIVDGENYKLFKAIKEGMDKGYEF